MTPEAVLQELDGLRALARSLVRGDADADDLLQDTAVAALEHPPAADQPVGSTTARRAGSAPSCRSWEPP